MNFFFSDSKQFDVSFVVHCFYELEKPFGHFRVKIFQLKFFVPKKFNAIIQSGGQKDSKVWRRFWEKNQTDEKQVGLYYCGLNNSTILCNWNNYSQWKLY